MIGEPPLFVGGLHFSASAPLLDVAVMSVGDGGGVGVGIVAPTYTFTTAGLLVALPSLTVSMNVNCPAEFGAVNLGLTLVLSVKVTGLPAV